MPDLIIIHKDATDLNIDVVAEIDTFELIRRCTGNEIPLPEFLRERPLMAVANTIAGYLTDEALPVEFGRLEPSGDVFNSFNDQTDLNRVFQGQFYAPEGTGGDYAWGPNVYLAVEISMGGDPRGAYSETVAYACPYPGECGILDWVLGWNVTDAAGEPLDYPSRCGAIGYANHPTSSLASCLDSPAVEWCEDRQAFRATLDGEPVYLTPYHTAEAR